MKAKLSLVASACLLAGTAFAQQGSVTIYGIADVGITSVSGYRVGRQQWHYGRISLGHSDY
jgi:predicted porin